VWKQFRRGKLAMAGLVMVVLFFVVAVLADFLASDKPILLGFRGQLYILPNITSPPALRQYDNQTLEKQMGDDDWAIMPLIPYGPLQYDFGGSIEVLQAPGEEHLLGTDDRGRDVLARMIHGTRVALEVGLVAVAIYVTIGTFLGSVSGFFGGAVDLVISRITEVMLTFPTFFFILTIQGMLSKTSILSTMVVIGLTRWTDVSRLVRGEVLRVRALDYVVAARALGARDRRILWRHVLPNALGPVLVSATFGIAGAILIEGALTFLGFGTPPPTASWGEILTEAYTNGYKWWLALFPGLAIFLTVTSYSLVGEGLRDAIDPRLRMG
jgi:peptide/nickel transport system permease protein